MAMSNVDHIPTQIKGRSGLHNPFLLQPNMWFFVSFHLNFNETEKSNHH
uniref:Uncharacterized protein n=1 Tax=Arundo donax TaxID=35708 RepID=A0A0A8ZJZ4_ARUDO